MHEFQIIKKYFSKLVKKNKSSLNLNDDVFFDSSKQLVISVDTYIDGIHFIDFKKPELVIKKILTNTKCLPLENLVNQQVFVIKKIISLLRSNVKT